MELYVPSGSRKLSDVKSIPQIRLGIQGFPGSGKTWSGLTFPNPVVANCDRGLGAHFGRADVTEIPFYDPEFCKSQMAVKGANYFPHMLKDIITRWLEKEAPLLTPDQTLVWDGNTGMQNAYHRWYEKNKVITSDGSHDSRAEWGLKKKYYAEVIEMLKALRCHVVFIAHEAEKKEKDGEYRGKVRPLLSGSFGDELVGHFTDWFRQIAVDKPTSIDAVTPVELLKFGMDKATYKAFVESFPRNTMYYWQTESDNVYDGKCSSLTNFPRFVPANYETFIKYRRKIST